MNKKDSGTTGQSNMTKKEKNFLSLNLETRLKIFEQLSLDEKINLAKAYHPDFCKNSSCESDPHKCYHNPIKTLVDFQKKSDYMIFCPPCQYHYLASQIGGNVPFDGKREVIQPRFWNDQPRKKSLYYDVNAVTGLVRSMKFEFLLSLNYNNHI